MMIRVVVLVIALLASASAQAYEKKCEFVDDDGACNHEDSVSEIQRVQKGTPYRELRERMLALGYEARPTTDDPDRCRPELAGNCLAYPETVSCSAAGGADCQFVLYQNGVAFLVKTLSGSDNSQRLKSVHHMTIADQRDLETSFAQPNTAGAERQEARTQPTRARMKGKIDVPIVIGGDAKFDACVGGGHVKGLDPRGDGFLSVQSGPGGRPYREIDRLYNGNRVVICDERGPWLGVLYGPKSIECGTGSPWPTRMPYTGPCSYGWIHSRYVKVTNG